MTITIIIAICILLLVAYTFDLTTSKTKIPSVILLLIFGWGIRQISQVLDGLITILLFFAIPASQVMPLVNKSLIIQVIIITALIMMFGMMLSKKPDENEQRDVDEQLAPSKKEK